MPRSQSESSLGHDRRKGLLQILIRTADSVRCGPKDPRFDAYRKYYAQA